MTTQAQNNLSLEPTISNYELFQAIEKPTYFNSKEYVNDAMYLSLQTESLQRIIATRPRHLQLALPTSDGQILRLNLKQEKVLSTDFQVVTEKGTREDYDKGVYYSGTVNKNTKSIAAVSIFKNMVMAVLVYDGQHYVLGHLNQDKFPIGKEYILYRENDLQIANSFTCGTGELDFQYHDTKPTTSHEKMAKVVKVYFEGDYRLYQDKDNSTTNVTNYITGLYNVVRVLYQNENINTEISEIFVWTSNDPYPTSGSSVALDAFQNRLNGNYNGDLAHLLSSVNANNGGIAYVDALCAPVYGIAYSNIGRNYSEFPTYSWTVGVVTHEMGHNLGSPHTQSCTWQGGALDNCYPVEGNCSPGPAPSNGGTIMSYCHLSQYGINFNNGFGEQPGDLIRARVNAATCLGESDDNGGGGNTGTPNLTANTGNVEVSGRVITITQSISNIGDGAATGGKIGYYLSSDDSFSTTDDHLIGTLDIPNIAAGSNSSNLNFNKDVSIFNIPEGTYYVVYYIDYQDVVSESDEGDNLFYWSSPTVTITSDTGGGDNGGSDGGGTGGGYCDSAGGDADYEWISNVVIGDLNSSSNSDGGYRDFTNRVANLGRGTANDIILNASYSGDPYSEYWRIWIDFNQDNDFNDAGELVFESTNPKVGETIGVLNIPANANLISTRMRISMKWYEEDNQVQGACDNFGYGEVEDYTVNIIEDDGPSCSITNLTTGEQTPCDPTTNTYEQLINVSYSCDDPVSVGVYVNDEYLGAIDASASPVAINITGLVADGNPVDIKVEVCENGVTDCPSLTETDLFTAPNACEVLEGEPCENYPSQRTVDNITTQTATINWSAAIDARYYQVRVRVRQGNRWSSWYYFDYSYENSLSISGLTANTRYQFRIRTRCSDGWTRWSPNQNFYTPADLNGGDDLQRLENIVVIAASENPIPVYQIFNPVQMDDPQQESLTLEPAIHVFPNPAHDFIRLELNELADTPIEIYSIDGTLQQQIAITDVDMQIDISNLQKGIYYLRTEQDGEVVMQRLIKL